MARRRYVYTPRRSAPSGGPSRTWAAGIAIAVVLGVVIIRFGVFGGGDLPAAGDIVCPGPRCPEPEAILEDRGRAPIGAGSVIPPDFAPAPLVTAQAVTVLEEPCGAVLYGRNEHIPLPPASLTKIVSALVAVEHATLNEFVPITIHGPEFSLETDSTVMGIEPGDRLTVRDLIYGMLLPSGNDAAIAIAEHVAGSVEDFAELMNAKVASLGLVNSRFSNPHGLDAANLYSSAYDMAVLGAELLEHPDLAQAVRTRSYLPGWDGFGIDNMNLLLRQYPGAIGVKTGYTDLAGPTIVAAAEREGRRIVVSLLNSQDLYVDAMQLLDWALENPSACAG